MVGFRVKFFCDFLPNIIGCCNSCFDVDKNVQKTNNVL